MWNSPIQQKRASTSKALLYAEQPPLPATGQAFHQVAAREDGAHRLNGVWRYAKPFDNPPLATWMSSWLEACPFTASGTPLLTLFPSPF